MRCQACDRELTDYESVRKDSNGDYLDICSVCLRDTREDALYPPINDEGDLND
jgi:hypothetical protein